MPDATLTLCARLVNRRLTQLSVWPQYERSGALGEQALLMVPNLRDVSDAIDDTFERRRVLLDCGFAGLPRRPLLHSACCGARRACSRLAADFLHDAEARTLLRNAGDFVVYLSLAEPLCLRVAALRSTGEAVFESVRRQLNGYCFGHARADLASLQASNRAQSHTVLPWTDSLCLAPFGPTLSRYCLSARAIQPASLCAGAGA